jgi:cytochrome P450
MSASTEQAPAKFSSAASKRRSFRRLVAFMWQSIIYRITCFLLNHHLIFKLGFALLRRVRPVAIFRRTVIVTKASDIRDVLDRFDDFHLGEVLRPNIPWGPFLMTIDWRDQHARERKLLQCAVDPAADRLALKKLSAARSRAQIDLHGPRQSIDLVSELAEPVMVAVADKYFGITPIAGDLERMARTMGDIASLIMVIPPEGSRRWAAQRESIVQLSTHIADLIRAKRSALGPAPSCTLLDRLVRFLNQPDPDWLDPDWVRRHVIGLAGTGTATVVRATTHAVDRLMARPAALRRAQALAARLDADEQREHLLACQGADQTLRDAAKVRTEQSLLRLRQIVYEALRFRPMLPLLLRYSPRETTIAKNTTRARIVPAGSNVLAGPLAAMFDPEAMEMPWHFCSSRPIEDFLHFGHGERVCFGKYVADVAMIEIIRSLLRLPGLKRTVGRRGRVRYDGPVPRSLVLSFERIAERLPMRVTREC